MLAFAVKTKACIVCGQEFVPRSSMATCCRPICAIRKVRAEKEAERKQHREKLQAIKKRSEWLAEAQAAVNRYVRLRDQEKGCISCPRPPTWNGQWHASHFRSTGAASAVRFHLWNIHKACSICNNHKSGNLSEYEPRLRALIGAEKVDWLRAQNQRADYSVEYLARLKRVFTKKAKRLQTRMEAA